MSAPHPPNAPPNGQTADGGSLSADQLTTEFAAKAKALMTDLLGALRDYAIALLDEQKTHAANEIATLGDMLDRSVQSLDSGEKAANVTRYAEEAAQQVGRLAERLRNRSLAEIAADVDDFARRLPLPFIIASVGVGLMAGRLLASSGSRPATQAPADQQTPQTAVSQPAGASPDQAHEIAHPVFSAADTGGATPSADAASRPGIE